MTKPFTSPILPPPPSGPYAFERILDDEDLFEVVVDCAAPTLPCPPSRPSDPVTIVAGLVASIEAAASVLPPDSREVVRLRKEARQIERLLGSLQGQLESARLNVEIQALNARLFRGQS